MNIKKIAISLAKYTAVVAFWIAVWCVISYRVNSELLFPSPFSVIKALGELVCTKEFWITAAYSLLRVIAGIVISLAIGTVLAVLTERVGALKLILSPAVNVIKSTPVASFIILALLWVDRGSLPVLITALIVVPIVWSNVSEGIRSVDKSLIEVTKVYNFSTFKRITKLYVPSVAPFFIAACRSSLGMAWKAGISAEVLATPENAIGRELYFSKTYLETPALFAWTLVVIILSIVIEKLFIALLSKATKKMNVISKGEKNDQA